MSGSPPRVALSKLALRWLGVGFLVAMLLPLAIGLTLHALEAGAEELGGAAEEVALPGAAPLLEEDAAGAEARGGEGDGAGSGEAEAPAALEAGSPPATLGAGPTPTETPCAAEEAAECAHAEAGPPAPAGGVQASHRSMRDAVPPATLTQRLMSVVGILAFLLLAWSMSNNRRLVPWRVVAVGVSLQVGFAFFILKTPVGRPLFEGASAGFVRLLSFTNDGSQFLFASYAAGNEIHPALINFVFAVLPTIIFFSSLMTVLYYLGVMQRVVSVVARAMQATMGTSGSETTSASANIFVGQTEAPLMVKPFVERMTESELMAVMTAGFATVAGGVLALYIQFLAPHFPGIAAHLMAASVMAAPGALVIAKLMHPETEESETRGRVKVTLENTDANVIDAAARGAAEGLQLALNVAAMLLAFVALIAMINFLLGVPSYIQHGFALRELAALVEQSGYVLPSELLDRCHPGHTSVAFAERQGCVEAMLAAAPGVDGVSTVPILRLDTIFGVLFWPIAFLMGAPVQDCMALGQLLGQKMVVNELFAYLNLSQMLQDPAQELHPRTVILATYALCGFANFSSIAIQIGGIGSIAPRRRGDLARIGIRAMLGGTITAFLTATIAGLVI